MQELLNPKTVALIGATDRKGSVGLGIAKNLLLGKKQRKLFFVNPNSKKVLGQKTYSSALDIKEGIDLAIIAVPAKFVKQVSLECLQAKVKACIIISSGFAETGKDGAKNQKEIAQIFKKGGISLIGPNCLGVLNPKEKLNASFAPETPKQGNIAFLSQSGALIDSIIDKSLLENFGFSLMVSYGNEAGLLLNDFLSIASNDENTKVIAVYLEEIKSGQEFIRIASGIAERKPIIILKGGKTESGKKAVQSHTASLAGDEKIYSAAFKKAGIIEVGTIRDLFLASQALAAYSARSAVGVKWAILTNGGAVGVVAADWCSRLGVKLSGVRDILGDATSEKYQESLEDLLKEEGVGGVIFCQTLQTMTDPLQNAKIILDAQKKFPQKFILPLFLGGKMTIKGSELLIKSGHLCFNEPRDAAFAASLLG